MDIRQGIWSFRGHSRSRLCHILILTAVAVCLGGCGYIEELDLPLLTESGRDLDRYPDRADTINILSARDYPENAPISEPLDIEVVRVGNAIRLENRTVRSYGPAQLWLNHQYGAGIDNLPVGRGEPINLRNFINEHGEAYPVARFLAPDADQPLVLADLVIDGEIHKLIVRLEEDWREP